MHDVKRLNAAIEPVDYADWLKTAGIIFVFSGHFGYFFLEDDRWWSVFGRFAAPVFFFLLGYARSRTVPPYWIWLGIALTLLESWNADWEWVAPNILLSFALIRLVRPYTLMFLQAYGWIAFVLTATLLAALAPLAGTWADYGTEGWLWALFGLCQRQYADANSANEGSSEVSAAAVQTLAPMRLAACLVAVMVYVWQEQQEFSFAGIYFAVCVAGLALLSILLCFFQRGPSGVQPPHAMGVVLRFVGRHTLEIYAIQLAGSELITLALDLDP
jgi:hypothetical protein